MLGIADEDLFVFKSMISPRVKALQKVKKITFQGTQYANCILNYDERRRSLRAISLLTEAELQVESDLSVRLVSEKVFVS